MINKLFPQEKDLGVELVWYDDVEDAVEILSRFVEKDKPIGIDKTWPARFLLRLQELKAGSEFRNGSLIVDYVRMVKDEHEQQLMREASLANDKVMEQVIPLVVKSWMRKCALCMQSPDIQEFLLIRLQHTGNPVLTRIMQQTTQKENAETAL